MRRRARAIVSGRVQGVSYRASTIAQARRLGLSGWVRNLSDGTVELECEGDAGTVQALLTWCEKGPPGADVTGVAIDDRPLRRRLRVFPAAVTSVRGWIDDFSRVRSTTTT